MLVQRRRRWTNIKPALDERLLSAGGIITSDCSPYHITADYLRDPHGIYSHLHGFSSTPDCPVTLPFCPVTLPFSAVDIYELES